MVTSDVWSADIRETEHTWLAQLRVHKFELLYRNNFIVIHYDKLICE